MKRVALTLRLPPDIYEEAKEIARGRGKSFSGYVRELLEERLKEEKKKRLFDAFSLVAADAEEVDVEFAFEAQKEVVFPLFKGRTVAHHI